MICADCGKRIGSGVEGWPEPLCPLCDERRVLIGNIAACQERLRFLDKLIEEKGKEE